MGKTLFIDGYQTCIRTGDSALQKAMKKSFFSFFGNKYPCSWMAFEQAYEQVRQDIARDRGVDNPILLDDSFIFSNAAEKIGFFLTKGQAQELADRKWSFFAEIVSLYPDVPGTLKKLRERFRLVLCLDGCGKYERQIMEKLGLNSLVDSVIISDAFALSKASPQFWQKVIRTLPYGANSCMVIDDRPEVIAAASAARISAIRVRRGKYRQEKNITTPSIEVPSLQELVPLLLSQEQVLNTGRKKEE